MFKALILILASTEMGDVYYCYSKVALIVVLNVGKD